MKQQWGGDGEVAIGVEGRVDVAGNGSDDNGGVNARGSGNGGSGDGGGDNNGCGGGGRGGAV